MPSGKETEQKVAYVLFVGWEVVYQAGRVRATNVATCGPTRLREHTPVHTS